MVLSSIRCTVYFKLVVQNMRNGQVATAVFISSGLHSAVHVVTCINKDISHC